MTRENTQSTRNTSNHRPVRGLATRLLATTLIATLALTSLGGAAYAGPFSNVRAKVRFNVEQRVDTAKATVLEKAAEGAPGATLLVRLAAAAKNNADLVAFLEEQHSGLATFLSQGGPAKMRADLSGVLKASQKLSERTQQLRCFVDADAQLRTRRMDRIHVLINATPAAVLYAAKLILDGVVPEWRTRISHLVSMIPADIGENVCEAVGNGISHIEMARCDVLRRRAQPNLVKPVIYSMRMASVALKMGKEFLPSDQSLTVAAVGVVGAGGGGGAGTDAELPLKGIFTVYTEALDEYVRFAEAALKERDICLADDDRMERDLISCTPLASYDADFEVIHDLAVRRASSLGVSDAEFRSIDYSESFGQLCSAYQGVRFE